MIKNSQLSHWGKNTHQFKEFLSQNYATCSDSFTSRTMSEGCKLAEFNTLQIKKLKTIINHISTKELWNQELWKSVRNGTSVGIAAFHCMVNAISDQDHKMYL